MKHPLLKILGILAILVSLWAMLVVTLGCAGGLHAGGVSWYRFGFWPLSWNKLHVIRHDGETICVSLCKGPEVEVCIGASQIRISSEGTILCWPGGYYNDSMVYDIPMRKLLSENDWAGPPAHAEAPGACHDEASHYGGGSFNFETLRAGMGKGERWMTDSFAPRARAFEEAVRWLPFGGTPPPAPEAWNSPNCRYEPLSLGEHEELRQKLARCAYAYVWPQGKPSRPLAPEALTPILQELNTVSHWYRPLYQQEPTAEHATIILLHEKTGASILFEYNFRLPCCLGPQGECKSLADFFTYPETP